MADPSTDPESTVPCQVFQSPSRLAGCVVVLLALFATGASAERIQPPLDVLYSSSNVLIAGKLQRVEPDGRLVFGPRTTLSGTSAPGDRIRILADADTAAEARKGRRYLVGYTILVRDPHNRKAKVPNPNGPALVSSPGLEPALFEDTRALRAILEAGRDPAARTSRAFLDLLLAALRDDRHDLQNLAAHELAYRPALAQLLADADHPVLAARVDDADADPAARRALLEAAFHHPERFGSWWPAAARKIVTTTPVDGYISTTRGLDGLVMAAFGVLQAGDANLPDAALGRWVESERPALAERALLMLRKQAPQRERPIIREALANPALPAQTRTFLNEHLRRLDFMERKLGERANGTAANAGD